MKPYRLLHWHGNAGHGDYKILFRESQDIRDFMRAFLAGRRKEAERAAVAMRELRNWEDRNRIHIATTHAPNVLTDN